MILLQTLTDYGVVQKILDQQKDNLNRADYVRNLLFILLAVNIISLLVNYYFQIKIKNRDKNIHGFKIREEKRIGIYEKIYGDLSKMDLVNHRIDKSLLLSMISDLEKYIRENNLLIEKEIIKICISNIDYLKLICNRPNMKDIKKEKQYLDNFKKQFNRNT